MINKKGYGLKDKIILIVLSILIYMSYDFVNSSFFYIFEKVLGSDYYVDIYLIDSFANTFLLIIYYFIIVSFLNENKKNRTFVVISTKNEIVSIVKYLVISLGLGGISSAWLLAVDSFLYKISFIGASYQKMMQASSGVNDSAFIFVFLSAVIISPIVEELLFRGILFNLFRKISARLWLSIILSSLLFGIWHGILVQAVYATILGIILTIIYYKTQNLWICIGLHIINNFISTVFTIPYFENLYFYLSILQLALALPCVFLVYQLYCNPRNYKC